MTLPPPADSHETHRCPSCGAIASGRFCAECGAPLQGAICASCRAALTPGAKFCHRCGTPAGAHPVLAAARTGAGRGGTLPWGIALASLLILVAFIAGRNFATRGRSAVDGPTNALPQAGLDDAVGTDAPLAANAGARAPDISSLSPRQRADRLYDRVMRLSAEGKADSVQFFAPMALSVYESLGPLDLDARYDLGRIGEAVGIAELATAQADTILRTRPTHLLGLVLAARAAKMRGDTAAERSFERRLIAAAPAERGRKLEEYERHRGDLDSALAAARRGGPGGTRG